MCVYSCAISVYFICSRNFIVRTNSASRIASCVCRSDADDLLDVHAHVLLIASSLFVLFQVGDANQVTEEVVVQPDTAREYSKSTSPAIIGISGSRVES